MASVRIEYIVTQSKTKTPVIQRFTTLLIRICTTTVVEKDQGVANALRGFHVAHEMLRPAVFES